MLKIWSSLIERRDEEVASTRWHFSPRKMTHRILPDLSIYPYINLLRHLSKQNGHNIKRAGAPPNKKTTFQNISSKKNMSESFLHFEKPYPFLPYVSNLVLYLAGSQATKKDGCNHSKLRIDGRIPKGPDAKSCLPCDFEDSGVL